MTSRHIAVQRYRGILVTVSWDVSWYAHP